MTRLKKVAIYNIAVVLTAIGAVSTIYYWTRQPYKSLMGMPILAALCFSARLFKGKGGPEWDERERRIGGKAKLAGYTVFWVCHILGLSLAPYLLGYASEMPVWLLSYIPIASVYILICSMSLALVYFESEPPLAGVKRLGFWLVVLLFCLPLVGVANFARSSQFEAAFAGDELAEWHIVSPEEVEVSSHITLIRWVHGADHMTVTLPYTEATLVSASYAAAAHAGAEGIAGTARANVPLSFKKSGASSYKLDLPAIFPPRKREFTKMLFKWQLPIDVLDRTPSGKVNECGPYRVRLDGLIPVSGYALKVVLGPESGFKMLNGNTNTVNYAFTCDRGDGFYNKASYGSCALCIEPIEK
jgi:FtsH-binding integral membrane protein